MLVLASSSPRRRELMSLLGVPFRVVTSNYNEPPPPTSQVSVSGLVTFLASSKALEVARRLADESLAVIGADTLVTLSSSDIGIPLGKPIDAGDARRMLALLAGRTHFVYTGVAVVKYKSGAEVPAVSAVRTAVTFRELSSEMIDEYVKSGEPMDKAGAYGAQGYAAPYIKEISGDFYNVVGLPLCALGDLLESCGVFWWKHRSSMPPVVG